jgi:uncharacterized protein YndB with AHSA1/START domain
MADDTSSTWVIGECEKKVAQMPHNFRLTTVIPASPQEVYNARLDNLAHSEMMGGDASMSGELGAEVSAWDGSITGRNLELVPGGRIVQSWRTTEFADEHEDSVVSLVLEEVDGGTLLTLAHTNVPEEHTRYEQGGWQQYYFEPMQKHFSKAGKGRGARAPKAKAAALKSKAKSAAVKTKASAAKKRPAAGGAKSAAMPASKTKPSPKSSSGSKRRK